MSRRSALSTPVANVLSRAKRSAGSSGRTTAHTILRTLVGAYPGPVRRALPSFSLDELERLLDQATAGAEASEEEVLERATVLATQDGSGQVLLKHLIVAAAEVCGIAQARPAGHEQSPAVKKIPSATETGGCDRETHKPAPQPARARPSQRTFQESARRKNEQTQPVSVSTPVSTAPAPPEHRVSPSGRAKTFRIFVSSTFSDMKEERNALQRDVFPRLRNLCASLGCHFQAIDLRWGVSEEAALDQQTMKMCLQEIERCQQVTPRPNFIILLGDRYGWRPLPFEIAADEFEALLEVLGPEEQKRVGSWYQRDANAVPPVYCLLPRTGECVDGDAWQREEGELRSLFLSALEKADIELSARSRYLASATEQEILKGALGVPDAAGHVFCFSRSLVTPEGNGTRPLAATIQEEGRAHANGTLRSFLDLDGDGQVDAEASSALADLKARLADRLGTNMRHYTAEWTGDGAGTAHLGTLCRDVYDCLERVITSVVEGLEAEDELVLEGREHDQFARERSQVFVGREDILRRVSEYLGEDTPDPLLIWGESGSGKSALMGKAFLESRDLPESAGHHVLSRFIGVTPASADGRSLLEGLCRGIRRRYGEDESAVPREYRVLEAEFGKTLGLATEERPLVVFLDALDQLSESDEARSLRWLPDQLPSNVHLVLSTTPGDCLEALRERLPEPCIVQVGDLTVTQGEQILDLWLDEAGRKLQSAQRRVLLDRFRGCPLPLYLKLSFEQSRRWRSNDVEVSLAEDAFGLIDDLLEDLSRPEHHGEFMVSRALGYLAASRHGLSEDEMLDALSRDVHVYTHFLAHSYQLPHDVVRAAEAHLKDSSDRAAAQDPERWLRTMTKSRPEELERFLHTVLVQPDGPRVPVALWARFYSDLEPYLTTRSADGAALLSFFHLQFREVVADRYLAGSESHRFHEALAGYFSSRRLYLGREEKLELPNRRKLSELPYQEVHAELWDDLEGTLTDMHFVNAKCHAGMTYDLVSDYQLALDTLPENREERQTEREHRQRLDRYTRDLIEYASRWTEARQLHEQDARRHPLPKPEAIPLPEPPAAVRTWTDEEIEQDERRTRENPTRLDCVRCFSQFVSRESHVLTTHAPEFPLFTAQHAYNLAEGGPVGDVSTNAIEATDSFAAFLYGDAWREHISPHEALLVTMRGHTSWVDSVATTTDGTRAISAGDDKTLRLWDLATGRCLRTLMGHAGRVASVAITPDGSRALSGGWDHTVRLWNLTSGQCLCSLEGHTREVWSVAITPDGSRALSGSSDGTVRLWDLSTGRCVQTLTVRTGVIPVAITPDGTRAVSAGPDNTMQIWDLSRGRCLHTLKGHTDLVASVAVALDGSRAVSGSWDKTLRAWDLDSGRCLCTMEGHARQIESVAVTPDGSRAVSGSEDKTLRLWDLDSGRLVRSTGAHFKGVGAATVTPLGNLVLSGSDDTVRLWDLGSGYCRHDAAGHTQGVDSIAITANGTHAVSASADKTLRLWNLDSGHCVRILEGHGAYVGAVAITSDDSRAISGSWDRTLRTWDLASGDCLRIFEGHLAAINSVATTPDGDYALSGSSDHTVRLWDQHSGECLRIFEGHAAAVSTVAVLPDGNRALSGSYDKTLRLWDLASGQCLRITQLTDRVEAVAIAANGRWAVSGSDNLQLWNLALGQSVHTIGLQGARGRGVAITRDGSHALCHDGETLRLWNLVSGRCEAVATFGVVITGCTMSRDANMALVGLFTGKVIRLDIRHPGSPAIC